MNDFIPFKIEIQKQFTVMAKHELFVTAVSKDDMWEEYLNSFPEGTNPIFRERTEHDCQCCKQFIRACGNVVAIIDGNMVSIWDIKLDDHYGVVANKMSSFIKSKPIENIFRHYETNLGTDFNHGLNEDGTTSKYSHFHFKLPEAFVKNKDNIGSILSEIVACKQVFKRSLEEITIESAETAIELIEQGSLYRGEENKQLILNFLECKASYRDLPRHKRDNFCWTIGAKGTAVTKIRNTAIGTLLVDISEGKDLDDAVRMFESKVAPLNYKRPTALITKGMIEKAQAKLTEIGALDSCYRRHATIEDITINNVLFANRDAKKEMDVFDQMIKETPIKIKNLKKIEDVNITTFMDEILPSASNIELLFENRHTNNLMSLIAPQVKDSKNILKWDNNFSWSYCGEVADSMKERVKKAGGNVEGVLRFSIQWNDAKDNENDLDAHCVEPSGNEIYFPKQKKVQSSTGVLDVDIVSPNGFVAVENITWSDINKMQEGKYKFFVHNYEHKGGTSGFTAEIEYGGKIYEYTYNKPLKQNEEVTVAELTFSKAKGIEFIKSLPSTQSVKKVWGIQTSNFHKASVVMNSPNHWDGNKTGNKHYFFILENCLNPDEVRGFFNEFLNEELTKHRKVFEVLGSKTKAEKSDNQLSGLGFSSTKRDSILCRVTGSFTRIIRINF